MLSLKIIKIEEKTASLIENLLQVWESSVRATHLLSENEDRMPLGFMGIAK